MVLGIQITFVFQVHVSTYILPTNMIVFRHGSFLINSKYWQCLLNCILTPFITYAFILLIKLTSIIAFFAHSNADIYEWEVLTLKPCCWSFCCKMVVLNTKNCVLLHIVQSSHISDQFASAKTCAYTRFASVSYPAKWQDYLLFWVLSSNRFDRNSY